MCYFTHIIVVIYLLYIQSISLAFDRAMMKNRQITAAAQLFTFKHVALVATPPSVMSHPGKTPSVTSQI